MSFSTAHLRQQLAQLPPAARYWLAYSGGCDSHVLVHAMAALQQQGLDQPVHVIHINHGLQLQAGAWENHCRAVCEALSLPIEIIRVDAAAQRGESPEEAARRARYAAFSEILQADDGLLLAHHQDDQAETLMLQLLRGAGMKGLAAMPRHNRFAKGWLGRPLLDFNRASLYHYAEQQGLVWIDDPSNANTAYDRNYLRHDIMPLLRQRWPAVSATLSRVAGHLADGAKLLHQLAAQDWLQHKGEGRCLKLASLQQLEQARLRNLLRYWLTEVCGVTQANTSHLKRIIHEVIPAAEDANPLVCWRGAEVRRYRGQLYGETPGTTLITKESLVWDARHSLQVNGQCLVPHLVRGQGIDPIHLAREEVTVRYRQGGECCKPLGRGHHHSLKKLFQEWGVPPWRRQQVPLIYIGDELAQVVGYCICEPFQTPPQRDGIVVEVQ